MNPTDVAGPAPIFALLFCALCLTGCGTLGKLDAVSNLDASRASYQECIAENVRDLSACEPRRVTYEADLAEAQRTPGTLTDWPAI
jgi:hypothetical protein